ncbi:hypothetical protein V2O64_09330 [Verrucomicrobiaceae bacterium 227]
MRLFLPLSFLASAIASAAISVTGITTKTNYNGGTRTITVEAPAGFTTTATLNGADFPIETPVGISGAGFYELIVVEIPDDGGPATTKSFLFNIRDPERGSSETGLPSFIAAPLVNDAPSAVNTGTLQLVAPSNYPDELAIPIVARLQKPNGDPLWLHSAVTSENFAQHPIQLRRGFGYTILPSRAAATISYNAITAGLSQSIDTVIESETVWTGTSGTLGSNTSWPANSRIHLTDDLTIEAGATLTIGAGTIVKVATAGDFHIKGTLEINGTLTQPVVFAPASAPGRWGGFFLQESTSKVEAEGAIFFGACNVQNWFSVNSGYASHRKEQAVFLVGPVGASLSLNECFLIENDGQLLHNDEGGDISIHRSLLQGATSSGELTGGTLTIDRSALLAFPDATTDFEDGDNDGIYLTSGQHLISNTVLGFTKDDGIDSGGSPAASTNTVTTVQSCWFESILHEGMSNSGAKACKVFDSIFFNCGQTIEAGYNGPQSTLARSLSVANLVGARMGDNYNWDYANNRLTVADCLLVENYYHDIWGWDWSSWTYNTAKMTVTDTYISNAGDLARHPGNTAYDPQAHGSLLAPFMPVPDSNVGVALTGIEGQGRVTEYEPDFTVQLSTFSSIDVTVSYSLSGKLHPGDREEMALQSGTLTFTPGQTRKNITLPLPNTLPFGLLRVALSSPVNAEITGGESWYFDTVPSDGQALLIPRSTSGWKYDASRVEPATGWQGLPYDDSAWQAATTEVGFGENDENTTLSAAEQGPEDDRTTAIYFRKTFQLVEAAAVTDLVVKLNCDDGAVVFLNGSEIGRSNIAAGPVSYATLAANASPENVFVDLPVPSDQLPLLRNGENVIAVEVHQSSLTSSDLGFDLELLATPANGPATESGLTTFAQQPYLFWIDPALELEESEDLRSWSSLRSKTSPYRIPTKAPRKFFRLRRN